MIGVLRIGALWRGSKAMAAATNARDRSSLARHRTSSLHAGIVPCPGSQHACFNLRANRSGSVRLRPNSIPGHAVLHSRHWPHRRLWVATDGDTNILLHVDPPYQSLLTPGELEGQSLAIWASRRFARSRR